ncbi:F-box/LRR-repeat protein 25-like protein [Tanacetum coccineum]
MVEHHQSSRKTIRFNEITDKKEDHISLLPDCLLIDIISCLPETKEAIRTVTLSKRWQHLWPYVSNLIFIFYMTSLEEWNHQRLSDIVSSIDKTLTQCRQFNLTKFKLRTPYDVIFESHHSESEFVLDEFVFINSSFARLRLDGCVFNLAGVISWKNLTSLVIFQGGLDDGLIKNIISGSPLLETLELYHCYGFGRIDITSKSVKKLMIGGYNDPEDQWDLSEIVEINAPHILSLRITMYFLLWKVVLLNVSSLVEAELDYEKGGHYETTRKEEEEEMLEDLILSLRHVKKLQIGYNCLTTLGRLEAKGFTFPSNLEHPDWPDYDYDSSGSED